MQDPIFHVGVPTVPRRIRNEGEESSYEVVKNEAYGLVVMGQS